MDFRDLRKLSSLYKNCEQLELSGDFGKGLWPVDQEIGQFMSFLIKFGGLMDGLEVGAGIGYSSIRLAKALEENSGNLLSFEYYLPKVKELEKNLSVFRVKNVQIVPSCVKKWISKAGRKKYDFVFFDQRKCDYLEHLKLIIPKLKNEAFICADNVLSHSEACLEYIKFLKKDKRFETVTLEIGKGLEISSYKV